MALDCCGGCAKPFISADFPPNNEKVVFSFYRENNLFRTELYHNKEGCLAEWLNGKGAEAPSPLSRAPLYAERLGKNFDQIRTVFLMALAEEKANNTVTLLKELFREETDHCSVCFNEFPSINIRFDREEKKLYHETCRELSENCKPINCHKMAKVVANYVQRHPKLHAAFTPTRMPLLLKVAIAAAISLSAFVLNRLQFDGKNSFLHIVEYPAYLTVMAAQKMFARLS